MADKDESEIALEGATEGDASLEALEGEAAAGGSKKKKLILIIIIVLVVLIGGGAGLYFSGLLGGGSHSEEATAEGGEHAAEGEEGAVNAGPVFYEMDEFLVNLNTGGKQVKFLKMKIVLEVGNAIDVPKIEQALPRIRDSFQIYLRELRAEDLQGSAGIYRLGEELLLRVNKIVYPVQIKDVLFKDILVQ